MLPALAALALLALATPAAAQCCGDCSGDGEVTIDEVVTAVRNALEGCGGSQPTPTPIGARQCAYGLNDTITVSDPVCRFAGHFNATCSPRHRVIVDVDDGLVAVTFVSINPAVGFIAEARSRTRADLVAWSVAPFDEFNDVTGIVTLDAAGNWLTIEPDDPPFSVNGCDFVGFAGSYDGLSGGAALQQLRNFSRRSPPNFTRR